MPVGKKSAILVNETKSTLDKIKNLTVIERPKIENNRVNKEQGKKGRKTDWWIDEVKRFAVRREVPINDTETEKLFGNKSVSQQNNNLNARLQFYDKQTKNKMRKNFELLFSKICDLHNKHLEIIKTL